MKVVFVCSFSPFLSRTDVYRRGQHKWMVSKRSSEISLVTVQTDGSRWALETDADTRRETPIVALHMRIIRCRDREQAWHERCGR
jgi:hypothetical protein